MWPWGHLALGYVVYAVYVWGRYRRTPTGWPVVALAIGTQFPDFVDKPLAYWFSVMPEGRSLTHSLLVAVPLSAGVVYGARREGYGHAGVAFAIGYLTHPFGDGFAAALNGRFGDLSFMLWPVLPSPDYVPGDFGFHWLELTELLGQLSFERLLTDWADPFVQELWLGLFVVLLWMSHGMPPLEQVVGLVRGSRSDHRK